MFLIGGLLPRPAYFEKYLNIQKQLRYQWSYNCDVYLNEIWGEFGISKFFLRNIVLTYAISQNMGYIFFIFIFLFTEIQFNVIAFDIICLQTQTVRRIFNSLLKPHEMDIKYQFVIQTWHLKLIHISLF